MERMFSLFLQNFDKCFNFRDFFSTCGNLTAVFVVSLDFLQLLANLIRFFAQMLLFKMR